MGNCLCSAAEFHWRVAEECDKWPRKLLYFTRDDFDVESDKRKELANELVNAESPTDLGDMNAWKLRNLFLPHWMETALTGKLDYGLYRFLQDVSDLSCADTQVQESVNSIIRIIVERCPNIR